MRQLRPRKRWLLDAAVGVVASLLLQGCPDGEPRATDCRAYGATAVLRLVDRVGESSSFYDTAHVEAGAAYTGLPSCLGFDGLRPGSDVAIDLHERVWGTAGCFQYHAGATTPLGTVFGEISWDDQLKLENDALVFHDQLDMNTVYLGPAILLGGGPGVTPSCKGDWVGMISEPFPTEYRESLDARLFDPGVQGGPAPVLVVRAFSTVYADMCPGLASASTDGIYKCADVYTGYLSRE